MDKVITSRLDSSNQDELILIRFEEALTQSALSSSTIVNYLNDLRTFLRWGKGKKTANTTYEFSLLQVNQEHIRLYRHYLAYEVKRAAATVNRHLMALRKFYAFALEIGFISTNPSSGVSLLQNQKQLTLRSLTKQEIDLLVQAAQKGSRAGLIRRDAAILQLLLNTGLRVSEIVDLKKDDLIFNHPGVQLRVCDVYNQAKTRHLPVSAKVRKALNDYLQIRPQSAATDRFFLSQHGQPLSIRTVQRIISDCAKFAGLEGVSAQSIRRTYALQLYSETKDLALVSKRLGHQYKHITEQYLELHKNQ